MSIGKKRTKAPFDLGIFNMKHRFNRLPKTGMRIRLVDG